MFLIDTIASKVPKAKCYPSGVHEQHKIFPLYGFLSIFFSSNEDKTNSPSDPLKSLPVNGSNSKH